MTLNVQGRVVGIGTDICDIRRIKASLDKFGDKFAHRVLGDTELQVWQHRSQRWPDRGVRYLATRFSAKEAFSKAVGLGIHEPMQWRRCEILNRDSGEPFVQLHGPLKDWCDAQGWQALVTLSDETDYAVSFCVIQKI